jgi:hypothetical protein
MANTLWKIIADFNAVLSLKVAVWATTATISTATDDDGVALPAGNYFFTIDRNSSSKEYIYCALSGTSLSSIQSVSRQGVLTPGFARSHRAKTATVEITDFATLRKLADYLDGTTAVSDMTFTDITFTGTTTPGLVIKSLTTTQRDALSSPGNGVLIYNTTAWEFQARQGGAWVTVSSGSTQPNASTEVAGKVEMATSAESIAGTDTGGTGALLSVLPSDIAKNAQSGTFNYGTDTGWDDTYVVALTPALTSYTNGSRLSFTPSTTNTGACTVDFWPSVLNIKTRDGADPQNGVIRASKPVTGTVFSGTFILDNEDFSTSTNHGTIQIATDAEAQAWLETSKAITPYQYQNTERNVLPQVLWVDWTNPLFSCATWWFSSSDPFFTTSTVSASYPLLHRFLKQKDGSIKMTHRIVMSWAATNTTTTSCVIGSYVYVCWYTGSAMVLKRYNKDDLTNETNITISWTALTNQAPLFTDGTDLWQVYTMHTALKYTISGTIATSWTTKTFTNANTSMPFWCDGTNLWGGNMSTAIHKWNFASGWTWITYSGIVTTGNYLVAATPQSTFWGIMKDSTLSGKLYTFLAWAVWTICSGRFHVIDTF